MPEIAFVLPRPGAARSEMLVAAVRAELTALGLRSCVAEGAFPPARPGLVYAVVPDGRAGPFSAPPELLARTLVLDLDGTAPEDPPVGAVFDVSAAGVEARRVEGLAAERFVLGHTAAWAAPDRDAGRDLDVLVTGNRGWRSDRLVAAFAGALARVRSRIALGEEEPGLDLLRRAHVVLDVRDEPPARFDQLRAARTILSGAVLVAETAPGIAPLVPGDDVLCGRAEALGHLALEALEDSGLRERLRRSASARLAEQPLRLAVERLAAVAAEVDARAPVPFRAAWPVPAAPPETAEAAPPADPEAALLRRALKQLRLDGIETRRRMDRLDARLAGRTSAGVELLDQTPAYAAARPRVSVLVTLYEFERHVETALDSVATSSLRSVEVLVVDDASTDGSVARVRKWMRERPDVPALLVRHCWNRGLPHARNTAIDFARGELAFVLDADNALYPEGLARLVAALDADPDADFAYGVIECFSIEGPAGLLSVGEWEPERLRSHNWIDAMALIRTEPLRRGGGFATDPRLHGIEDYDLWCRMAEEGRRGVAVPEIVGRYRVSEHGMLRSTSGISSMDAMSVLIERHPSLMAGVAPQG